MFRATLCSSSGG